MAKPTVAAKGSVVDPKKPVYRNASSYTPAENVNAAPSGGKKGKITPGHGQTADEMGTKNTLVPMSLEAKDPYRAKGSDFPVKNANAATGQSGTHGMAEGMNDLVDYSQNQCGPRHAEDDGPGSYGSGTPVPGDRGSRVAASFPITQNPGESDSDTGEISIAEMVDLQTGYIAAGSQSRVKEVPEGKLSIGKYAGRMPKAGMQGRD